MTSKNRPNCARCPRDNRRHPATWVVNGVYLCDEHMREAKKRHPAVNHGDGSYDTASDANSTD